MKLLIVDDEMQIRTGLQQGILWENMGIEKVYIASNGVEALDICCRLQPELVITDIRMPGLDGIELSKKILEQYDLVEIIIISGHSDFEYARQAMRIGVKDYLLKPINIRELKEMVTRAIGNIENRLLEAKDKMVLEKYNKHKEWQQLLESNRSVDADTIARLLSQSKIKCPSEIVLGLLSADSVNHTKVDQFSIYMVSNLKQIVDECSIEILFSNNGDIFFLMRVISESDRIRKKEKLKKVLPKVNKISKNQFGITSSMVLSSRDEYKRITMLYSECNKLMMNRLYLGKESFIDLDEGMEQKVFISPVNRIELREAIDTYASDVTSTYLKSVFNRLMEMKITSKDVVKGVCIEAKNILIKSVYNKGVDVKSIFEHNQDLLNDMPDYKTIDEYFEWIDNIYYLILVGLSQLTGKKHSRTIIKAVDYISKNYMCNIDLEAVADYVNKSKNYFSYLFKKEMGLTFIEYLNKVRIDKAMELLKTTDDMTYEVAEKVGYNNYKYFSGVFKKAIGLSPAKYRKSN